MRTTSILALMLLAAPARAGLYYSGEAVAELPSRWGGFLIDQRALRAAGVEPVRGAAPSPLRDRYLAAVAKLEATAKSRPLTADEAADLGALYVRLGKPITAVGLLRTAARSHPHHFRITANLGTAWQEANDIEQALVAREEAVRFAPDEWKPVEEYHWKLVVSRWREFAGRRGHPWRGASDGLEDLFKVKYVGPSGKAAAGVMAAAEFKKLPANAAAVVQALALALPADGRLLWQLAEIANAHGDARTAAAILDGCVTEFGMASPDLRARRHLYRAAADEWAKRPDHEAHRGTFVAKSPRPLVRRFDYSALPPPKPAGANPLPWGVLGDTTVGAKGVPAFPKYLDQLDGRKVVLTGFIQPSGDAAEFSGFLLLEFPVGCWFCETPDPTGLVSVELEAGVRTGPKQGLVKVTGVLRVNRADPEDYLFRVTGARLGEPE